MQALEQWQSFSKNSHSDLDLDSAPARISKGQGAFWEKGHPSAFNTHKRGSISTVATFLKQSPLLLNNSWFLRRGICLVALILIFHFITSWYFCHSLSVLIWKVVSAICVISHIHLLPWNSWILNLVFEQLFFVNLLIILSFEFSPQILNIFTGGNIQKINQVVNQQKTAYCSPAKGRNSRRHLKCNRIYYVCSFLDLFHSWNSTIFQPYSCSSSVLVQDFRNWEWWKASLSLKPAVYIVKFMCS